ncbi:hypothetical protein Hanom_Chr17g01561491 [Helianthus anomalus]
MTNNNITITSSNTPKLRKPTVKRHLTPFKTLSNTWTRPRFLTPHPKPTAPTLTRRMSPTLSLRILSGTRLRTQIIKSKSDIGTHNS